jgi:flagellin
MVVQHNMQAANANRMLGITTGAQAKSTEKLSSGYKINRAADDAAGLAISEKMRSQIRGLDRASTNAQDGISVVQTAEGALNEVHSMLQRMNELATQAANDTNTTIDRSQIQLEVDQLTSEIDRVSSTTQFNTQNLLDGSFKNKNLQVGSLSGQKIELNIGKMSAEGLGIKGEVADPITGQHAILTESNITKEASNFAETNLTKSFDGTDKMAASTTYIYDKSRNIWHKDGDPTATDAGFKLKDGFTADDGATIKTGATSAITTATSAPTGLKQGGAKVKTSDVHITHANLTDKTDGVYKFDGSDWVNESDPTMKIAKADVTDGTAEIAATNGSTITLKGYQAADADHVKDLSLKVDSFANAGDAMERIQKAIDKVSTQRAELGAVQNRLEHTIANLDNVSENTQAAESRIRDTDMAKEMVTYSKNNILAQAGQSMLAQANQSNQGVLSLLQ